MIATPYTAWLPVGVSVSPAAFDVRGLSRIYPSSEGAVAALHPTDIEIPAGTLTVLKGHSGSGKSTLLRLLAGLDRPTTGEVFCCGEPIPYARPAELQRHLRTRVSYVFQEVNLIASLSARENVAFPLVLNGAPWSVALDAADAYLSRLGLAEQLHRKPVKLSQGQKQRVAVAKALVSTSEVILADEPTSALDQRNVAIVVRELLNVVKWTGRTVVLVTHDQAVIESAHNVLHCEDGTVTVERLGRTETSRLG